MPTTTSVREILHSSLTAAQAAGLKLIYGSFGDCKTTCCALSSVLVGKKIDLGLFSDVATALGVNSDQAIDIAMGFDGGSMMPSSSEFFFVGRALREEFNPEFCVLE